MTKREARRIAMRTIIEEVDRMIDVSDEWLRHPDTHAPHAPEDVGKIKDAARDIVAAWNRRHV